NTKALYAKVSDTLRRLRAAKQGQVIGHLNPILRGWANYHRSQMASRTFAVMDHRIFCALWRWAKRRHPNKGARWVKNRYFKGSSNRQWVFSDGSSALVCLSSFKHKTHIKVKSEADPYDSKDESYFDAVVQRR